MSTQHTAGPWIARFEDYEEWRGVESTDIEKEGGGMIARVYGTDAFPRLDVTEEIRQEFQANARLIACAPELLRRLDDREKQLERFRDCVLNERFQLEEGTLNGDQINQVLELFDDQFGPVGNCPIIAKATGA